MRKLKLTLELTAIILYTFSITIINFTLIILILIYLTHL
mgnify:CR=1 FL=1